MSLTKILQSHQISTEIINLIKSAEQYCYLITPYYKPWGLLNRALEEAAGKRKKIFFFIRADNDWKNIALMLNKEYQCEVRVICNLHTKLYLSDKAAIISSMNLYDISNSRNIEMGYLVTSKQEVMNLKKVIVNELLTTKYECLYKGWFYEEEAAKKRNSEMVVESTGNAGYCVSCGKQIKYDTSSNIKYPKVVRCYDCYLSNMDIDEWTFPIEFCHYCGKEYKSKLAEPLHKECKEKISSVLY